MRISLKINALRSSFNSFLQKNANNDRTVDSLWKRSVRDSKIREYYLLARPSCKEVRMELR